MRPTRRAAATGGAMAVAFAALLGLREGREAPPAPRRHVVEIRSFRFEPGRLAAAPGDTVVWINRDMVPHTATADDRGWDSGELASGASWSRVVPAGGLGEYLCSYHPTMTGAVVGPRPAPLPGDRP